jgi:hypothetical protein
MNTALLRDKSFQRQMRKRWAEWAKQTTNYPTMVTWWEKDAKVYIKKVLIREGTDRRRKKRDGKLLLRLSL